MQGNLELVKHLMFELVKHLTFELLKQHMFELVKHFVMYDCQLPYIVNISLVLGDVFL